MHMHITNIKFYFLESKENKLVTHYECNAFSVYSYLSQEYDCSFYLFRIWIALKFVIFNGIFIITFLSVNIDIKIKYIETVKGIHTT